MLAAFLNATFRRLSGGFDASYGADGGPSACTGTLEETVERVVEEISPRLRAVPGYARRLREPLGTALHAIDQLVEDIPQVLPCHRTSYATDPLVNAFFVNYAGLQEVFSQSREVRDLFDTNAGAEQCFALLCMQLEENRKLGVAVDGDVLRKDVLQTTVSFTDHQAIAPGVDEADARTALNCCIFDNLVRHIHLESAGARTRAAELERRAHTWQARLQRADPGSPAHAALQREIDVIETERQAPTLQLNTLEDLFDYVTDALSNPHRLMSARQYSIFTDRLGIRYDGPGASGARELPLTEVHVAGHCPRIACLVSFPRAELLPKRDLVREASVFLAA